MTEMFQRKTKTVCGTLSRLLCKATWSRPCFCKWPSSKCPFLNVNCWSLARPCPVRRSQPVCVLMRTPCLLQITSGSPRRTITTTWTKAVVTPWTVWMTERSSWTRAKRCVWSVRHQEWSVVLWVVRVYNAWSVLLWVVHYYHAWLIL